jgi:hypothetical protein
MRKLITVLFAVIAFSATASVFANPIIGQISNFSNKEIQVDPETASGDLQLYLVGIDGKWVTWPRYQVLKIPPKATYYFKMIKQATGVFAITLPNDHLNEYVLFYQKGAPALTEQSWHHDPLLQLDPIHNLIIYQ